jgi:hypothetical protein
VVTLEEVTVIRAPIEVCFDLARSVEVHLARLRRVAAIDKRDYGFRAACVFSGRDDRGRVPVDDS